MEKWRFGVEIATLVFVIVGARYVVLQTREMTTANKQAVKAMQDAADDSTKVMGQLTAATTAMTTFAAAARDALTEEKRSNAETEKQGADNLRIARLSTRPLIGFRSYEDSAPTAGKPMTFHAEFKNVGNSAAIDVKMCFHSQWMKSGMEPPPLKARPPSCGDPAQHHADVVILPSESIRINFGEAIVLTEQNVKAIADGEVVLGIRGWATYHDANGTQYETVFCRTRVKSGLESLCAEGEDVR